MELKDPVIDVYLQNAKSGHRAAQRSHAPRLAHRQAFEEALRHYQISPEGLHILGETPFAVMVAPTSTGRNTIINELLKTGQYYFIVSDTTRPPRMNNGVMEQDGVEYFFRSEEDMLADIRAGLFVEAEIIHSQQVSGVSIREIKRAHDQGKIAITDIEILGGITVATLKPDAAAIYLLPPSFEEWIQRIQGRTPLTDEELRNRLRGAMKGFKLGLESDCFTFVINDKLKDAVRIVDEIARLGVHHRHNEHVAKELARTLYHQTEAYLQKM
ncbi:MAG TPA: hypothetical protein VJ836_02520 [Candidatus Saccharimonadales bacterium]|nr:hypothetical protein [Candidatus Saccharimonadales bacterium]